MRIKLFIASSLVLSIMLFWARGANADEIHDSEIISEDTVWEKDDHIIKGNVYVETGATLTIEKGSRVLFSRDKNDSAWLDIRGKILAIGTNDEKIIFASVDGDDANYYIGFDAFNDFERGQSFFRYVDFIGGGYYYGGGGGMECFKNNNFFPNIINTAFAAEYSGTPTFLFQSGRVHIENSSFTNNKYFAVAVESYISEEHLSNNSINIVNSNFELNSNAFGVNSENLNCSNEISEENCERHVFLKNNWYGNQNGPILYPDSEDLGSSNLVYGKYFLDGWRKNSMIADPLVIVPGITGSGQFLGSWKLDPITHVYDDLVESMKNNGYEENINLFAFPYEWRNGNETSAHYLQSKIEGIISETGVSKVDVVAHSMGGLIARAYVEDIGSINYENTIDQLITLGTPHKGAPKDYLIWEAGEGFFSLIDKIAKHHFKQEAEHAGCLNLKEYIQEKVLSVRQLLPEYSYLFDVKNERMREYYDDYPRNAFLEELNEDYNVEKLEKVNFVNIIGNLENNESTISKMRVVDSTIDGKWEHGMPENFYNDKTDRGLERNSGDETVPLHSAEGIPSNKKVEIDAAHGNLPTVAQCEILKELTGKEDCNYINNWYIPNILLINVFSPVDIQIISPSGKKVGKDFNNNSIINEIDGAFYTGFDTENEFITIPNPEDGEYKILNRGTDSGEYKIEVAKISENENDPQNAAESSVEITGTATSGSEEELKIEVDGDEISTGEPKDTTPPIITAAVTTDPNENGWYKNDVTIRFTAEDNESGIEGESEKDRTISSEGENQSITETFNDIAGNTASKTVSGINIDKTVPETIAEILGTKGENDWLVSDVEIKFSGNDNLSGVNKTYFSLDGVSFEAGNSVNISNNGEHVLKYYSDDLAGNIESEKELSIKIDKTAPEIKIISPENKKYLNNENISLNYNVSDGQSGVKEQSIFWDAKTYVKNGIDLSLVSLGEHIFKIIAKDYAGNSAENQIKLNVTTNPRAMIENVEHYFKLGLIKNKGEKNFLIAKLSIIEQNAYLLNMIKISPFFNQKTKNVLEQVIKKITNNQIDLLIFQINHHPNVYDKSVKGILIECLNFVRI